jgi:putative hydroxymethylpyrimidine transport system substrate-binding protein
VRRALIALAVLGLLVLAGCGERKEKISGQSEPLDLVLDFYVNPDHAGIYQALDKGYFDQAGLDVKPIVPSDPSGPIKQVAAGRADLAISYEPEVLLAQDQGLPVKAIAALVPQPLTSLISLPDAGIKTLRDLPGKTIATAGIPYQATFLNAILDSQGLQPDSVDQQDVGLGLLPAVLSGKADAMLGGFSNVEGVDLAERGQDPRVVPVNRLGVPAYDELVLVANTSQIEDDPEPLQLFLQALEHGTRDAAAHPQQATDAVLSAGDGLDPALTAAEIKATLPLLQGKRRGFGVMNASQWTTFGGFMTDQGYLQKRPDGAGALTNDLLPKRR